MHKLHFYIYIVVVQLTRSRCTTHPLSISSHPVKHLKL
jgi:hypothetical protein